VQAIYQPAGCACVCSAQQTQYQQLLLLGGCAGMTFTICTASVIQQLAQVLLPGCLETIHMNSTGSPAWLVLPLTPADAAIACALGVTFTTSM
jgi:hypothetical protein